MTFEALETALGQRRVTPIIPDGRAASGFGQEPVVSESNDRDQSSGWSTFLTYVNAKGERSERRVTCRRLSGEGRPVHFHGYCHERKQARSFRIDRILEMVDYRTGEVVEPMRHFEELRMHGLLPMQDRGLADLAVTMVFMARCDGEFHPMENAAIEEGLNRYLIRCGGSENEIETVLERLPTVAPDSRDLVDSVERLLKAESCPSIARLILDCSGQVMIADGEYGSDEVMWSNELQIILRRASVVGN